MALLRKAFGEYMFVGLVLLIGISASFWVSWRQNVEGRAVLMDSFHAVAQDRIRVIESAVDNAQAVLKSLAAFFEASESVDPEEYALFTHRVIENYPYIQAMEWIPVVAAKNHDAFLREARRNFPDYSINELNGGNKLKPVSKVQDRLPIYYLTPLQGNERVLGFDLLSDPIRSEALAKARSTHHITATGRIELLQDITEDEKSGILLFSPVYQRAPGVADDGALRGYVASLIPVSKLVQLSIKPLSPAGVNVVVHDIAADGGSEQFLDVHSSRIKRTDDLQVLQEYEQPDILRETETFDVAGRKWRVTVLATKGFYSPQVDSAVWLTLGGGLLLTLMLSIFMIQRIQENQRITLEVAQRTQELAKTKRQVELILRSTHDGIMGLDREGKITFVNPMTISMLGFTRRELIGQTHHALFHHSDEKGVPIVLDHCPIQQTLEEGTPCTISDEVFWTKDGQPLPVEYATAPIMEDDEINGAVVLFRDITERKINEGRLEQLARYDLLTGVANRTLFVELLKKAMPRAVREGKKLAVIYMDLNGFKPVNDTLGHAAGDMVLKGFASRILTALREHDTLARMGGDEFTILATDLVSPTAYEPILERCRKVLQEPFNIDGHSFPISASVGVAVFPDDASELDDLISKADHAMYEAKRASKKTDKKTS